MVAFSFITGGFDSHNQDPEPIIHQYHQFVQDVENFIQLRNTRFQHDYHINDWRHHYNHLRGLINQMRVIREEDQQFLHMYQHLNNYEEHRHLNHSLNLLRNLIQNIFAHSIQIATHELNDMIQHIDVNSINNVHNIRDMQHDIIGTFNQYRLSFDVSPINNIIQAFIARLERARHIYFRGRI